MSSETVLESDDESDGKSDCCAWSEHCDCGKPEVQSQAVNDTSTPQTYIDTPEPVVDYLTRQNFHAQGDCENLHRGSTNTHNPSLDLPKPNCNVDEGHSTGCTPTNCECCHPAEGKQQILTWVVEPGKSETGYDVSTVTSEEVTRPVSNPDSSTLFHEDNKCAMADQPNIKTDNLKPAMGKWSGHDPEAEDTQNGTHTESTANHVFRGCIVWSGYCIGLE